MNGRLLWILGIALVLSGGFFSGCKKSDQTPSDELAAAQRALSAADLEKCAKKEFEKARDLLAQAQKASDEKRYEEAKKLAEQAADEARHARDVALANPDCQPKKAEPVEDVDDSGDRGPHQYSRINFTYDSSTISGDARSTLTGHAEDLLAHPDKKIRIEGHCSEEGSTEYNLALGERRAKSVKKFLVNYGVQSSRIETISYGKERPIGTGSVNRRAEFIVR